MLWALFILLWLGNITFGQSAGKVDLNIPFKVTAADGASLGLSILAGIAGGVKEAYHADPYVFENNGWNGKYYRHNAWENNYPGGDWHEGEETIKPEFLNGFRDVWHGANDMYWLTLSSATFTLGISEGIRISKGKSKWWHSVVKGAIIQGVRIGTENIVYSRLR